MNDKNIFIVIPVHDRKQFTRECLLSLRRQTLQNFRVIVVDDGSTDGTGEMIEKEFPEVVLLKGDGNLWWTGATNMGVEYTLTHGRMDDYILTLNNDTKVKSNYLQALLGSAQNYTNSLIGSIAVSDEDEATVVDAGVRINWLTAKHINLAAGRTYADILREDSLIHKVDVLPGRGTLIPIEVFKEAGLYDFKNLPHYGADYEFSRRANMKGYDLLINYEAVVLSNVKMTGLNNRTTTLGWRDLIRSFFSIRSPNNLMNRWRFARLCCHGWRFPVFYLCDTGRVILGSLLYQTHLRN
jgi:GT2 family glycosyltransferase